MAYTEALDPETPADGDLASEGDDSIRQFKRAIIERLLTVFKDVDVDPLEFIDEFIQTAGIKDGAVTSAKLDPAAKLRSIVREVVEVSTTITYPHGTYVHDYDVVGASPGDSVILSWAGDSATFVFMHAWVPEEDVVRVTLGNDSNSSDLALVDEQLVILVIKATLL